MPSTTLNTFLMLLLCCCFNNEVFASTLEESNLYSPQLSTNFLAEKNESLATTLSKTKVFNSDLFVSSYDEDIGLFVGYEATNGVRLLFKSKYLTDNTVFVRVKYRDEKRVF